MRPDGLCRHQARVQWVPEILSVLVEWPGREGDHSPACSAEYTSVLPHIPSWRGV
jgi:hypothetical protein